MNFRIIKNFESNDYFKSEIGKETSVIRRRGAIG